jgi:hypothetical protein
MQPKSPNDQFDFILKDSPKPKKSLSLPIGNLPKPVGIAIMAVVGLVLLLLFFSLVFGSKTPSTQPLVESIGRAQDIARVSKDIQQETKDPDTKFLASTVESSLTSEQSQLTAYLKSSKYRVDPKQLLLYKDGTIDAQLVAAAQNNKLEATYISYLKTSLGAYQNSLDAAYKIASPKAKVILGEAYDSVKTLLSAPQFSQVP